MHLQISSILSCNVQRLQTLHRLHYHHLILDIRQQPHHQRHHHADQVRLRRSVIAQRAATSAPAAAALSAPIHPRQLDQDGQVLGEQIQSVLAVRQRLPAR